ncbi:Kelch repeat-containing protein [Roseibium sp. Sym1]|uniref:Kelch repeat-containing protein n=1 Tax=Roseibium sp. Sym1 TaxID=3016006 RepID=UPI0022B3E0D8|nr:kelch repeat-containing protein [Roseibium sp. Sym1]
MNPVVWKYLPIKPAFYPLLRKLFGWRDLSWSLKASLPVARYEAGAIATTGKIYVFGGAEFSEIVDGYLFTKPGEPVFEYDPATNIWNTADDMPTPRSGCCVMKFSDERICVVGGFEKLPNQWVKNTSIDIFDPDTQSWTPAGQLHFGTTHYAAVLVDDRYIYAFGGIGTGTGGFFTSRAVWCQDLQENTGPWPGSIPLMPTPRHGHVSVAGKDGLIYVIGGLNDSGDLANVEVYDREANIWQTRAPMLCARRHFAAVVGPAGHIYVFGGMSCGAAIACAEKYDPVSDSWTPLSDLPRPCMYHSAVVSADNRVFLIGGFEKESCEADPVFLDRVWASTSPLTE